MRDLAHYLAVDLGASSGRVLLGRWDGERFAVQELHRFPNGPVEVLSRLYWDVLRLWTEIKAGLASYTAQFAEPLTGLGLDTWGVDMALLDASGHLLGNPVHYRDRRTDGMPEQVFRRVPREQIFYKTGIQFMQINTLYQLFSMVEARDPQLGMAEALLMMPDLFNYWLTGRQACEYTIASTSQMLDARERCWAIDLLGEIGIPTQVLPPLMAPGSVWGELRVEVMEEVGLGEPVPVIATGSHDTASAVAAIPELDGGSLYISSGTWSLVGVEVAEPVLNDEALALNFTNEGGVGDTIRLLKNVTGLWLLQECQRQWGKESQAYGWEDLLHLAEQATPFNSLVDPDAHEFMRPGDMPAAIQAFCRRTGQPAPESVGAVVRCCLESLALKYRWVMEALERLIGRQLEVIRIVGGGGQNHLLCQFTADACQRPVVAGPVEATALGNLMLQAVATGRLSDLAAGRRAIAASVERQRFDPRPSAAWEEAFRHFKDLFAGGTK